MRRVARSCLALAFAASLVGVPRAAHAAPHPSADVKRADVEDEIELVAGQTIEIPGGNVKTFAFGDNDILRGTATDDGKLIVLFAKKIGQTNMVLNRRDGSSHTTWVHVYPQAPERVAREAAELLGKLPVRLRRVGGHFFIEGNVTTEAEAKRCAQIAALYPGQVESVVGVGSPEVDRRILVRIDFFFTQYERSSGYAVGLGWPASVSPTGTSQVAYDFATKATSGTAAVLVNQPLPSLDIAATHGWAKIMKQSTVVTSNGSLATFESGGEQNYSVNTGLTIGVQKIPYGASVSVKPSFDPVTREVELHLDASVADLTAAVGSGGLPGRTVAKLVTDVHVKAGQSLVLSGIRTQSRTHDVSGLPGLSEIPVLGLLFGSHHDARDEVEGAIFIVPSLVESVPKSASETIEQALTRFESYDGSTLPNAK